MIEDYLNQTVMWSEKTGKNQYNEPEYAAPIAIDGRFEYKRKLVRNAEGEQVVSEAQLFTTEKVKSGDKLNHDSTDFIIITAGGQPGLSGDIEFYEAAI
jgi:hypothetical protein